MANTTTAGRVKLVIQNKQAMDKLYTSTDSIIYDRGTGETLTHKLADLKAVDKQLAVINKTVIANTEKLEDLTEQSSIKIYDSSTTVEELIELLNDNEIICVDITTMSDEDPVEVVD